MHKHLGVLQSSASGDNCPDAGLLPALNRIRAYMMLETSHADVHSLVSELHRLDGIVLAHPLVGPTDVIAFAEADHLGKLTELIDRRVAHINNIGSAARSETLVLLSANGASYSRQYRVPSTFSAWVLAKTRSGRPYRAVDALRSVRGVVQAHAVFGSVDVIAYVEVESMTELCRIVDAEISAIGDITHADTRMVLSRQVLQAN